MAPVARVLTTPRQGPEPSQRGVEKPGAGTLIDRVTGSRWKMGNVSVVDLRAPTSHKEEASMGEGFEVRVRNTFPQGHLFGNEMSFITASLPSCDMSEQKLKGRFHRC